MVFAIEKVIELIRELEFEIENKKAKSGFTESIEADEILRCLLEEQVPNENTRRTARAIR